MLLKGAQKQNELWKMSVTFIFDKNKVFVDVMRKRKIDTTNDEAC